MVLDTSGLLCLHHKEEPHHRRARALFRSARSHLTHSYVLAEFVALTQTRRLPRGRALRFLRELISNPAIEIVWVEEELHETAMKLLEARLDKSYSLCDAVSFVLMRQRGLFEALTTDHHFEQEGFRCLLG
jgi:predicted nucleic acid-binding protein